MKTINLITGARPNFMKIAPIVEILMHLWAWIRGAGGHGIPVTSYTI